MGASSSKKTAKSSFFIKIESNKNSRVCNLKVEYFVSFRKEDSSVKTMYQLVQTGESSAPGKQKNQKKGM